MQQRFLGKTDIAVSAIGLGCMGFSHAYGYAMNKQSAIKIIREAYEMGYTFFDTAKCYTGCDIDGNISFNEEIVGEALEGVRKNVVIATKFGVTHKGDYLEYDSSRDTIIKSLEESLEKLKTDYIDLYYQHRIDPNVEPEEVALVMKELIAKGKIRAWGISEVDEDYLRRAHAVCPVTAIQNRYSLMATWYEHLIDVCEELKISFIAFSPLANGILTGCFNDESIFDKDDFRNKMPQYQKEGYMKVTQLLDYLKLIAMNKRCTLAQVSIAWMMCKSDRVIPIPGSRKIERIKENFNSQNIILNKKEIEMIDQFISQIDFEIFGGHK